MRKLLPLFLSLTLPNAGLVAQQNDCTVVPPSFSAHISRTLTDSTGMFARDFPPVAPLSCELLGMLQEELKDDSASYCFDRLSRKYWSEDPHARRTHAYIRRHLSFPLAMAATAHWFADTRIDGLRELQEYRRMRPLMCTTKEGAAKLGMQDRAAVRYLVQVMETTPMHINGSENAAIHSVYLREAMLTLDLFTGKYHMTEPEGDMRLHRSEAGVQQAIADWRNWLNE
ncbi:MAG: hypothetical protein IPM12_15415 [Flavobacteriales bacterium]|nr:hypothetical protein [Flavobacteriales bacterium]